MLADLEGRINTDAEYQRGVVWSEPQQQLLIDSIFRGFDLPKIFLRKLPDGSPLLYDVVDGVQRLTAIWRFLSDQFALPKSYTYTEIGPVGGRRWSELPQDAKDRLQFARITVTELETDNEDDIRELFQRLQKGEPLNAAERRNAMNTPVRRFVAEILAEHPLWPETGLSSRRFAWHEMSAIVLALVKAQGPTGLKGADLFQLYEDESLDADGETAARTVHFMDLLAAVASVQRGALRNRWGIVDLLLSLMRLDDEGLLPSPEVTMRFFLDFEHERKEAATQLSDLRATIVELAGEAPLDEEAIELPAVAPDMLTYVNAFAREGATQTNVEIRAEVMLSRLRRYLQDQE